MAERARTERETQNRILRMFVDAPADGGLGYAYLGNWEHQRTKEPVERELLLASLLKRGYSAAVAEAALGQLERATEMTPGASLYAVNQRVYALLRYGATVKQRLEDPEETVFFIDWDAASNNDWGVAEEVTLSGSHDRRPDLVLYLNGIAIGVMELKRSSVNITDGVRQLVSNQDPVFHPHFFTTVQLLLAGSDAGGLWYGTVTTPEQFYVQWTAKTGAVGSSVSTGQATVGQRLDPSVRELCTPERLLDFLYHCIVFDAGQKKVPRQHQYDAFVATRVRLAKRQGGVIWHTQGSGKSILMVMIAKWILETDPDGRVLVVTDREELEQQICKVMHATGAIPGDPKHSVVRSRADLVQKLGQATPRLLSTLIHKFDTADLSGAVPQVEGALYVLVDECHRTQGGDMNAQMKRWLPGGTFVGFTGTPLLKSESGSTQALFGSFIHTYKFAQAVADRVVLDLRYEAREVPQQLSNRQAVDDWFDSKTAHLTPAQKARIRQQWGTMEALFSSKERKSRIVASIIHDFATVPRLNSGRGTAILVAESIADACHYFRLFQEVPQFRPHVGLVTSYTPDATLVSKEPLYSEEWHKYDTYTRLVLAGGQTTEEYEKSVKKQFCDEPARMKLLIVVSKLLTGFDAPSCSYIYLDQSLRDHTLFQAICRTNRLDGDDKPFGHVVDFAELFQAVEQAVAVYSDDLLEVEPGATARDNNAEMRSWLPEGKKDLERARDGLALLCGPIQAPKSVEQFLAYFCGELTDADALKKTESRRQSFYKAVAVFARAYATLSGSMRLAGYSQPDAEKIKQEVQFYAEMRASVKQATGEDFDIKPYEADMRHLLDTYISASPAVVIGTMGGQTLTELIASRGIARASQDALTAASQASEKATVMSVANNLRRTISTSQFIDPAFYKAMSKVLDDLLRLLAKERDGYKQFLAGAEKLALQLARGASAQALSPRITQRLSSGEANPWLATLARNLPALVAESGHSAEVTPEAQADLAIAIDAAMTASAPANWQGDPMREVEVYKALYNLLDGHEKLTDAVVEFLKSQPSH